MKRRILLIEDEETFRDSIETILLDDDVEIVWAATGSRGIQAYKQDPYGFMLVLIDYRLPDHLGSEVCSHLRRINPDQMFLFTSQYFDPDFLKDQLRTGANGFVDKSSAPHEIRNEILRKIALFENEHRLLDRAYEPSKAQRALEDHGMIGRSQAMFEVLQKTLSARKSSLPTLIIGETGAGKELIAQSMVPEGKKIVAISGAYYAEREQMLESELFGYVKGAFTDAKSDTPGLIMQANNHVLFIDELHLLPLSAQGKLLRFFQEMKFRRVGDHSGKEISVNFKLIAATHPCIKDRMKDGRFLPDLFERIGTLVIDVPPLRERREDIELLVQKFQDEFNSTKTPKEKKTFRIITVREMSDYSWPTNVRGLKNAVMRMMTNCQTDIVSPRDFADDLKRNPMNLESVAYESAIHLGQETRQFEINAIKDALKKSRTRVEAAARLGMAMTTFLRKLTKFEIDADSYLTQT